MKLDSLPPQLSQDQRDACFRRRCHILVLLLCGLVLLPASMRGNDQLFEEANRLYEQGKYADAAAAYARVTSNAPTSAAWFNLGNAQFKAGELGEAIAAWKTAQRISPRDAAIRANLEFGRRKVDANPARFRLEDALSYFTPNEWTGAAAIAFASVFVALAAGEWKRRSSGSGGAAGYRAPLTLFLIALLLGVAAGISHFGRTRPAGVIMKRHVAARFGPLQDSQVAFQLNEGSELLIQDHTPLWLQVRDGAGRIGWVPRADVILL